MGCRLDRRTFSNDRVRRGDVHDALVERRNGVAVRDDRPRLPEGLDEQLAGLTE